MYKMCIFTLIVLCIAGSALAQTTVYVDGSVATTGDGTQAAPFKTITEALALANATILVVGGTYTDETPYTDILSDQTLIGSYDSSFTTSDPSATPTIIDMGRRSQLDQKGTFFIGSSGWTIENLVIQNSTTGEYDDTENGGAVYVRNGGNGTFRGVTFFNCHTKFEGGVESGPAREGGAVCIRDDSTVVFEDCVFDSCTAVGGGGAVRMRSARGAGNTAKFYRCLFTNCGARNNGSVIDDGDGTNQVEIVNCIFANNGVDVVVPSGTAPSNYLIRVADRRALIYNCTFVGNNNPAGYMFNFGDSSNSAAVKEIVNCIVANNTIASGGSTFAIFSYADDYDDATTLQNNLFFSNSDLDPLDPTGATIIGANGNITGDPQFADAANGDYHLKAGSPGEDAGQTLALVFDDFARTLRPVGSAYDIGALEGQTPLSYKVRSVMATASSSVNVDLGPEKTVDESGLNAWGQHDTTPTNMWLSSIGQEPPVWIQYEFDIVRKLDQMWVWNSNTAFEPIIGLGGLGVKTATIEYSTDGSTWTPLADVPEFGQAPGTDDYTPNTTVYFNGVAAKFIKITCTSSWGGGGQYGLSEVRFFYFPVQARYPNPRDGATGVAIDTTLSWLAGTEAAEHNVYFSDDEQSVIDGTVPTVTVSEASYGPLSLDLGSMYYWRVDEVNNVNAIPIWEGDVWSFTTIEYLVADDFEDYNDYSPDRIFETWKDGYGYSETEFVPRYCGNGTGATVGHATFPYAERTIVHEDSQSMPFYYDNSGTGTNSCGEPINLYYSETERTFGTPQDWTRVGVKALTLYFYGDPNNTAGAAERMYVKLNGVKVVYDGDMADLKDPSWHEWNIDLASFAGADLQNVTKIGIGIGNGTSPGGSGVVYFDDIRLYQPRCVPGQVTLSEADLNGDCVVDFTDLEVMTGDWLATGPDVAADLNADTMVDLKDYAVLANQWLDERLWPAW